MSSYETGSPQDAPARGNWQPELGQDYETAMARARENRRTRAQRAAAAAIRTAREHRSPWLLRYMFPQLPLPLPARRPGRALTQEEITWSVRGQARNRASFGHPHPGDFRGGLPVPGEFPELSRAYCGTPRMGIT